METMTRRMYLELKAMQAGASILVAIEAVASVAIEHPEWDMEERKSWQEWERRALKEAEE